VLDFNPHETELLLFINVETFRQLTGALTVSMNIFLTYVAGTWGKTAFAAVPKDLLEGLAQDVAQTTKPEFFSFCTEAMAKAEKA
jgi:hypothetical protein